MNKTTSIKTSTDKQNNINTDINKQTKQHRLKHQQIDKTTPIQTSTDRQNNTNENIDRQTKQHQ